MLLEWGAPLGFELDSKELKSFKKVLEGRTSKDWASALKATERFLTKTKLPFEERSADLLARLEQLSGRFVEELAADLASARDDVARFGALVEAASERPRLWLARERFGW